MFQSRKTNKSNSRDFQVELQNRLNQLSNRRSHKKLTKADFMPNHPHYYDDDLYENENALDRVSRIVVEENSNESYLNSGHEDQSKSSEDKNMNEKKRSNHQNQERKSEKKRIKSKHEVQREQHSIFSTVNNGDLEKFLRTVFKNPISQVSLDEFITKCLVYYFPKEEFSQDVLKLIYLELQQQITTTDSQIVSLNALEITLKRKGNSLKNYVYEKLLKAKNSLLEKRIDHKNDKISRREEQITEKENQLMSIEKQLRQRERQINKKEKSIHTKEKQLINKHKQFKKLLEDRSEKLASEYIHKIQAVAEKMERKINNFERNLKYKMEGMDKKSGQIHRLRQFKQQELRVSLAKEIEAKHDKIFGQQIRKLQKQLKEQEQRNQVLHQQRGDIQEQGNKLLKVCSNLQSRTAKLEKKNKTNREEMEQKNSIIRELEFLIQQKSKQNEQLMKKFIKNQNNNEASGITFRSDGEANMKSSKSKKSLPNMSEKKSHKKDRKQKPSLTIEDVSKAYELCLENMKKKKQKNECLISLVPTVVFLERLICSEKLRCEYFIGTIFSVFVGELFEHRWEQWNTVLKNQESGVSRIDQSVELLSKLEEASAQSITEHENPRKVIKQIQSTSYSWKLCIVEILLSPNSQNYFQWLQILCKMTETQEISANMKKEVKSINFISILMFKILQHSESTTLEAIELLTDIILNMGLTADHESIQTLMEMESYRTFIDTFTKVIGIIEKDQGFEVLQKMSIVLQRLVYFEGKNIVIEMNEVKAIKKLLKKNQKNNGILQPNLESILERFE